MTNVRAAGYCNGSGRSWSWPPRWIRSAVQQRLGHLKQITETLHLDAESPVMLFSAQTGEGKEKIWEWITEVMGR